MGLYAEAGAYRRMLVFIGGCWNLILKNLDKNFLSLKNLKKSQKIVQCRIYKTHIEVSQNLDFSAAKYEAYFK